MIMISILITMTTLVLLIESAKKARDQSFNRFLGNRASLKTRNLDLVKQKQSITIHELIK